MLHRHETGKLVNLLYTTFGLLKDKTSEILLLGLWPPQQCNSGVCLKRAKLL